MPMPREPPPIPKPTICARNMGLVPFLSKIGKGKYADVIVQLVYRTKAELSGADVLIVWDGSEWDRANIPLNSVYNEPTPEAVDAEVMRKSKGRTVSIFCYDFDKLCPVPIRSGDWIYLENLHSFVDRTGQLSSLTMHDHKSKARYIWRLEQPIADDLFYKQEWKDAIARVAAAQPLSSAAHATVSQADDALPTDAFFALLKKEMEDQMILRNIRLPPATSEAVGPIVATTIAFMEEQQRARSAPANMVAAPTPQQVPPIAVSTNAPAVATPILQQATEAADEQMGDSFDREWSGELLSPPATRAAAATNCSTPRGTDVETELVLEDDEKGESLGRNTDEQQAAGEVSNENASPRAVAPAAIARRVAKDTAAATLSPARRDASDDDVLIVYSATRNRGVKRTGPGDDDAVASTSAADADEDDRRARRYSARLSKREAKKRPSPAGPRTPADREQRNGLPRSRLVCDVIEDLPAQGKYMEPS